MRAYSTATGDQRPGWDAFDRLVQQTASQLPRPTVETIADALPAGISFHLIQTALQHTRTPDSAVRCLPKPARGHAASTYRRSHQAAA